VAPCHAAPTQLPAHLPTTENTHNTFLILSLKINKVCANAPSVRTPTNPRKSLMKPRTRIHVPPGAAVQGRAPKYAAGPLPPHLHCPSFLDCAASLCVSAPSAPSHGVYVPRCLLMRGRLMRQRKQRQLLRACLKWLRHVLEARPSVLRTRTTPGRLVIVLDAHPRGRALRSRQARHERREASET